MSRIDEDRGVEPTEITAKGHACRIAITAVYAAILLGWSASHTSVLFADGLRYVAQARVLDRGEADKGLRGSVDHPIYPLEIVAAHRLLRGNDSPSSWQLAAQAASIAASLLLVVPLYLIALEIYGERLAFPVGLLTYSVPVTIHVFADTMSESTFLLFWSWGLYGALRFLKQGSIRPIPLMIAGSALAYLTRPEGLLLPAALASTLMLAPRFVFSKLPKGRALWVVASVPIALGLLIGPYIAMKGGLGTKPSIARLLGTAPKSGAMAVEREKPLDPHQTVARTLGLATKEVAGALAEALSWPLVPFAILGAILPPPRGSVLRQRMLLWIIAAASVLALVRLHATGGYCTPRHTLLLALIGFGTAVYGMEWVGIMLAKMLRIRLVKPATAVAWTSALLLCLGIQGTKIVGPLNPAYGGYRTAGDWLARHSSKQDHVVDVTGWSQFYGERDGYTFANLIEAPSDRAARWVVVRDAHLRGPWPYCKQIRGMVDGLQPIETFPGTDGRRPTKVFLFDRAPKLAGSEQTSRQ